MKILLDLIPIAYDISKKVFDGKLSVSEGTKILADDYKMNESTARDYIYNFRYLMNGKKFSRTLNADSMEYFFENFLKEYGAARLENPLIALMLHINYYERLQKITMSQMRAIHKKYSEIANTPILITNLDQLIQNIETIENYITEGSDDEKLETSKLIMRGICFVAYTVGLEIRFAPSKFLGYTNNKLNKYPKSDTDGRETNKAINAILKSKPLKFDVLEQKYLAYCGLLGIKPQLEGGTFAVERKYWTLKLETDFHNNNELTGEFPEGKLVERTHKARERNSQVIDLAKSNYKKNHGKLFCQACHFDFEDKYGIEGKDFIEGHHTIAVSDMPPGFKTKPEDFAMLCANCHRMVHRKRPWLAIDQLSKLLEM
jgi:5-methylcytosine-specific restriction protein A